MLRPCSFQKCSEGPGPNVSLVQSTVLLTNICVRNKIFQRTEIVTDERTRDNDVEGLDL